MQNSHKTKWMKRFNAQQKPKYTKQETKSHLIINLEDSFGQVSVILLSDLGFVSWSVKDWRIVINVINVYDHRSVVLIQVVGGDEAQLILRNINILLSREIQKFNLKHSYLLDIVFDGLQEIKCPKLTLKCLNMYI